MAWNQMIIYSPEELEALGIRRHVTKIDRRKCRKINPKMKRDKQYNIIVRSLMNQFNIPKKRLPKQIYVGDLSYTSQAQAEFQSLYRSFFRSRRFRDYSPDWYLNTEPRVSEVGVKLTPDDLNPFNM